METIVLPDPNLSWSKVLAPIKRSDLFQNILLTINDERAKGVTIYPNKDQHFQALQSTPFADVKVVILGQDPYHGPNQAHGLSFSVQERCPHPPSLKNIFKELQEDCGIPVPLHGNLLPWAQQGVCLLNTVLSVRAGHAHSHANIGWEVFTDAIVAALNEHHQHLVFMLWGAHAQKKAQAVDTSKHKVLKAPHPSPLSAHRGFFGCRHFSQANAYLTQTEQEPIHWNALCTQETKLP